MNCMKRIPIPANQSLQGSLSILSFFHDNSALRSRHMVRAERPPPPPPPPPPPLVPTPMSAGWSTKYCTHTSRIKLYHLTAVLLEI